MGFLTSLFGGTENVLVTVLLSLGIVIVLIVLGVWVLKLLSRTAANAGRGRPRRLYVIESAAIDQRRRIVLIRRDNVEHLVMTGGAQDVVIEDRIAVPPPTVRRPTRPTPAAGAAPERPGQAQRPAPTAGPTMPARPAPSPASRPAGQTEPAASPAPPRRLAPGVAASGIPAPVAPPVRSEPPDDRDTGASGGASRTALDRLRELGRPLSERRTTSLRHTGLLRPVSRLDTGGVHGPQANPASPGRDSDRMTPEGETAKSSPADGPAEGDTDNTSQFKFHSEQKAGG